MFKSSSTVKKEGENGRSSLVSKMGDLGRRLRSSPSQPNLPSHRTKTPVPPLPTLMTSSSAHLPAQLSPKSPTTTGLTTKASESVLNLQAPSPQSRRPSVIQNEQEDVPSSSPLPMRNSPAQSAPLSPSTPTITQSNSAPGVYAPSLEKSSVSQKGKYLPASPWRSPPSPPPPTNTAAASTTSNWSSPPSPTLVPSAIADFESESEPYVPTTKKESTPATPTTRSNASLAKGSISPNTSFTSKASSSHTRNMSSAPRQSPTTSAIPGSTLQLSKSFPRVSDPDSEADWDVTPSPITSRAVAGLTSPISPSVGDTSSLTLPHIVTSRDVSTQVPLSNLYAPPRTMTVSNASSIPSSFTASLLASQPVTEAPQVPKIPEKFQHMIPAPIPQRPVAPSISSAASEPRPINTATGKGPVPGGGNNTVELAFAVIGRRGCGKTDYINKGMKPWGLQPEIHNHELKGMKYTRRESYPRPEPLERPSPYSKTPRLTKSKSSPGGSIKPNSSIPKLKQGSPATKSPSKNKSPFRSRSRVNITIPQSDHEDEDEDDSDFYDPADAESTMYERARVARITVFEISAEDLFKWPGAPLALSSDELVYAQCPTMHESKWAWPSGMPRIDAVMLLYDASDHTSILGFDELCAALQAREIPALAIQCKGDLHSAVDKDAMASRARVHSMGLVRTSMRNEQGVRDGRLSFKWAIKSVLRGQGIQALRVAGSKWRNPSSPEVLKALPWELSGDVNEVFARASTPPIGFLTARPPHANLTVPSPPPESEKKEKRQKAPEEHLPVWKTAGPSTLPAVFVRGSPEQLASEAEMIRALAKMDAELPIQNFPGPKLKASYQPQSRKVSGSRFTPSAGAPAKEQEEQPTKAAALIEGTPEHMAYRAAIGNLLSKTPASPTAVTSPPIQSRKPSVPPLSSWTNDLSAREAARKGNVRAKGAPARVRSTPELLSQRQSVRFSHPPASPVASNLGASTSGGPPTLPALDVADNAFDARAVQSMIASAKMNVAEKNDLSSSRAFAARAFPVLERTPRQRTESELRTERKAILHERSVAYIQAIVAHNARKRERDGSTKPIHAPLNVILDHVVNSCFRQINNRFVDTFLLTFRVFATPREVVRGFHERMVLLSWDKANPQMCQTIMYRLAIFIERWMREHPTDFCSKVAHAALLKLLEWMRGQVNLLNFVSDLLPLARAMLEIKFDPDVLYAKKDPLDPPPMDIETEDEEEPASPPVKTMKGWLSGRRAEASTSITRLFKKARHSQSVAREQLETRDHARVPKIRLPTLTMNDTRRRAINPAGRITPVSLIGPVRDTRMAYDASRRAVTLAIWGNQEAVLEERIAARAMPLTQQIRTIRSFAAILEAVRGRNAFTYAPLPKGIEPTDKMLLANLQKLSDVVIRINPVFIAEEMTNIQKEHFLKIEGRDWIRHVYRPRPTIWDDEEFVRPKNLPRWMPDKDDIDNVNDLFNYWNFWCTAVILAPDNDMARANVAAHMIEVAQALHDHSNYLASHAIQFGVRRTLMGGNLTNLVETLPIFENLMQLEMLSSSAPGAYRLALKETEGPAIPDLSVHVTDLNRWKETPDFSKQDPELINWGKWIGNCKLIMQMGEFQRRFYEYNSHDFIQRPKIRNLLMNAPLMPEELCHQRLGKTLVDNPALNIRYTDWVDT